MMKAVQEALLTILMLLLLASLLLTLEESSSMLSDINCRRAKALADTIRELASKLKLDADEYARGIEADACGG
ncbi:MAG: hypothetical protein NZ992_00585 [Candidatus Korarchaeum sp.]|nr:hypothetical protein [Candidatus Korarchaeum sp.]MDW8035236.1 hypothetical protein [Candidatus Korarchaeum sp.]